VKCDDPVKEVTADKKVAGVGALLTGGWALGRALLGRRLARGAARAAAGGGAEVSTGAAAAGRTLIPEGEALLVVVHEGRVVAQTADIAMSHAGLVQRAFGAGGLPEGAWVGTVGKIKDVITALNSRAFFQNQGPASAAIQELVKSLFF
jgi:hypothetical protein